MLDLKRNPQYWLVLLRGNTRSNGLAGKRAKRMGKRAKLQIWELTSLSSHFGSLTRPPIFFVGSPRRRTSPVLELGGILWGLLRSLKTPYTPA